VARKRKIVEEVQILSIADKGLCIGKNTAGQVFLAEKVVPGDLIDLEVRKKKKGLPFGAPSRFISYSDHRQEARCEYFGDCGGCKWQNLTYEAQLQQKFTLVQDAISRIGRQENVEILPIIGADDIYYYRNKLEYSFANKRWVSRKQMQLVGEDNFDRDHALGFFAPGVFYKVVDINTCHLQPEPSNKIKNTLRSFAIENDLSFYDRQKHLGLLRSIIVRTSSLGQVMVTVVFGENQADPILSVMRHLSESLPEITTSAFMVNTKHNDSLFDIPFKVFNGPGFIIEKIGSVQYKIGPKSFFQTNTGQAKKLYDVVVDFAGLQGEELVFDLYTGVGSIALYCAQSAKKVVGIDNVEAAIQDANENATLNRINNTEFIAGDVKEVLHSDFQSQYGIPDVVLTDPPRAGMHPTTLDVLLRWLPKRIVYVSCNPATQARDIYRLSEKYNTVRVQPVDMFPHTSHVESVALLELNI